MIKQNANVGSLQNKLPSENPIKFVIFCPETYKNIKNPICFPPPDNKTDYLHIQY